MSADGPSVLEWLNASRPGVCVTPTFSFAKRMLTDEDRCMIGTTGDFSPHAILEGAQGEYAFRAV